MNIAYLDPHAVPDDSPEALQILYTADALGQVGVNVILITPSNRKRTTVADILGREHSPNLQMRSVNPGMRWLPLRSNKPFYRAAIEAIGRTTIDAVLVRNLKMAEYVLKRRSAVPLFFETHELFAQSYREEQPGLTSWRKRRKLTILAKREHFIYHHARGLIALTQLLLDDIRAEYHMHTPAIVAADGVDLEQIQKLTHSAPNPSPILLYLGSLHPWKGVDVVIRAMPNVSNEAVLHVAGGNEARIEELRRLARDIGVERRVVFLGKIAPRQRFGLINTADICLLPLTESSIGARYTSPLKLFEYMAAAKPIVVSDLPSMHAVLHSEKTALMAQPGKPESFATAINLLLANPELRRAIGHAAAETAKTSYSWTHRAMLIADFIKQRTDHVKT